MATRGIARLGLGSILLALCVLLSHCGGKNCQECTTYVGCPSITIQCPGYTATVQQCSGPANDPKGCCATMASEVSCSTLNSSKGIFSLTAGLAVFTPSDSNRCLRFWIDTQDNGWVTDGMTRQEQEVAVGRKLAAINPSAPLK